MEPYKIDIDINGGIQHTGITLVQGDTNSNQFDISVYDGIPFDFTGLTPRVVFKKSDGTRVFQDSTNKLTVVDSTQGKISLIVQAQTISFPGNVIAEVKFYGAGDVLKTSALFQFFVREDLGIDAVISENDISPVTNALVKVDAWDAQFEGKYAGLEQEYAGDLTEVKTQLADIANKSSITTSYIFTDNTARDTYFTANPTELVEGLFISVGSGYQQRLDGVWVDKTAVISKSIIDDTATSKDRTWSSSKIDSTKANKTQEAWITPTLLNGWTANHPVGYYKDQFGIVHCKGCVSNTGATLPSNVFNFPTGYRSSQMMGFATQANNTIVTMLYVSSSYLIIAGTTKSCIFLDGVSFKAEE